MEKKKEKQKKGTPFEYASTSVEGAIHTDQSDRQTDTMDIFDGEALMDGGKKWFSPKLKVR